MSGVLATVRHVAEVEVARIVHRVRDDDGSCDLCGQRREAGRVRLEVFDLRHYLFPAIGRYCFECFDALDAEGVSE